MSVEIKRYIPHDNAVAEPNTNPPHKPAVGPYDSASRLHTRSQTPVTAAMNNNHPPWAQPFTPNYGHPAQGHPGQPHDLNRNRNHNDGHWQTPPPGYMQPRPLAGGTWYPHFSQPQQYFAQGQQMNNNNNNNNFVAQQAYAQAQAYYYQQWYHYYGHNQGFTPINTPAPVLGQQAQPPYPFFAPSFGITQPRPGIQGVSDNDLQYAFDKLYKGTKTRTRRTNARLRSSTPLSDGEPVHAIADSQNVAKEMPTVYSTTRPTGKSKEPKIMLPAPTPTEAYMAQAAEEPSKVEPSGRILVILDLNGTLLFRPNRNKKTMIARPFLIPFIRFLFSNFAVMVWSSARPENVASLVEQSLEGDLRKKLVAQWARKEFKLSPEHYSLNVQVYKNLDLVWSSDEIQQKHPDYANGGRFGQHNTVLIDDSMLKAAAQPYNLLQISEFSATSQQMREDKLREVAGYLETLLTQQDVSKFMKRERFQHSTGKWVYEWPAEDVATQGPAYAGGELQDKVSIETESKNKKKKLNKKARKREAANAKAAGRLGALEVAETKQAEESGSLESDRSDGEVEMSKGGVNLA